MKKSLAVVFLSLAVIAAQAADPAKAVPIFDGKSFKGWEGDTNKTWRIAEGASEEERVCRRSGRDFIRHVLFLTRRELSLNRF